MYVSDAVEFFSKEYKIVPPSRKALAQALDGIRHRSAAYAWPDDGLVPFVVAVMLATKSKGKLKVNMKLYEAFRAERYARGVAKREARKVMTQIANAPKLY